MTNQLPTRCSVWGFRMTIGVESAQKLVITDWHPQFNPNGTGNRSHWATIGRKKRADQTMVWAAAKQANWLLYPGKVQLEIVFVYPRKVRVDTDNLYARVKGCVDALKGWWIDDDRSDVLDLRVRSEVRPGVKALEMTLRKVTEISGGSPTIPVEEEETE